MWEERNLPTTEMLIILRASPVHLEGVGVVCAIVRWEAREQTSPIGDGVTSGAKITRPDEYECARSGDIRW